MGLGHHQQAVRVPAQDVAGSHPRPADLDHAVGPLDLHPILAGAHPVAAAEHRIVQRAAQGHVAADAVYHRAGDAAAMGDLGQDVAPDGGVQPPAVVDRHHRARRHVVDVVPHRPRRIGRGAADHGEGAAGHLESRVAAGDSEALADDAEPVQRVAEGGGVERGGAGEVGIVDHDAVQVASEEYLECLYLIVRQFLRSRAADRRGRMAC